MLYEMPLGYDVGLYRYFFLQYGFHESWLSLPDLPGWTQHHSPFTLWIIGRLVHLGIPVDFFIELGWSLTVLACTFAYVYIIRKKDGKQTAVVALLFFLLSFALFKTYTYMYWKTIPAAILLVATLYYLQQYKWLKAVVLLLLLAGTHTQTLFLLSLIVIPWWLSLLITKELPIKKWFQITGLLAVAGLLVLATQWRMVPWAIKKLQYMADGIGLYPGAFFPIEESLLYSFGIVLFAMFGFWYSLKKAKWTIWHTAVIVSILYTCSFLYFHRRFYIQFDWLVIPFAAKGLVYCWGNYKHIVFKLGIISILLIQCVFSFKGYFSQKFQISPKELDALKSIQTNYKPDYPIIVLENKSAFYVQGWLPNAQVIAPDLLNRTITGRDWSKLIFGSTAEKKSVIQMLPKNTKIIILPSVGRSYGKLYEQRLKQNECFKQVENTYLYTIVCQ